MRLNGIEDAPEEQENDEQSHRLRVVGPVIGESSPAE